jgi:hypothetical protein
MNSQHQTRIETLIAETEQWRQFHRNNRNSIEAAACAIRLKALRECLEIVKKLIDNIVAMPHNV